jgi:hypothetical protein
MAGLLPVDDLSDGHQFFSRRLFEDAMKPLTALCLAGVVAVVLGTAASTLREFFPARMPAMGMAAEPGVDPKAALETYRRQILKNVLLVDVLIAAAVCGALGIAASTASRGRVLVGLLVGIGGGAIAGGVGGFVADQVIRAPWIPDSLSALRALSAHAVLWMFCAVALTAAVVFGTRRKFTGKIFGWLSFGALIAASVYPLIAGLVFPLENSDKLVPDGLANTAIWIAVPTLLFAIAVGRQISKESPADQVAPAAATA